MKRYRIVCRRWRFNLVRVPSLGVIRVYQQVSVLHGSNVQAARILRTRDWAKPLCAFLASRHFSRQYVILARRKMMYAVSLGVFWLRTSLILCRYFNDVSGSIDRSIHVYHTHGWMRNVWPW
jgi:hypothetical protein